jgi:mannose-6-phosphate isomerase-like protein (cupin superfamily)
MIMPEERSPTTSFRPFFNPATGEWITYTAIAEDSDGQHVRFHWASAPGGVVAEHIHPRQEERFTIAAGQAHFTLNGQKRVASAGQAIVIPAGVPHSVGNPGPAQIDGIVERRPARQAKGFPRSRRRPGSRRQDHTRGRRKTRPARRHLLALPPRKPGHLNTHLGAEPDPPAVGAGQGLRRTPLLRPLGQPDPDSWPRPPRTIRNRPQQHPGPA